VVVAYFAALRLNDQRELLGQETEAENFVMPAELFDRFVESLEFVKQDYRSGHYLGTQ